MGYVFDIVCGVVIGYILGCGAGIGYSSGCYVGYLCLVVGVCWIFLW